jgi:hypothetical protein
VAPLIEHIKKGTFFMLHGARGAGKTTTAMHALRQVCTARGWLPLTVNMNAVAAGSSETFWPSLSSALHRQGKTHGVSVPSFKCPSSFQGAFSRAVVGDRVRFVLMFDEFDDLDSPRVGVGIKDEVSLHCHMRLSRPSLFLVLLPRMRLCSERFFFDDSLRRSRATRSS